LELTCALLVAGLFSPISSGRGWRRIGRAFTLWARGWKPGERATDFLAAKRLSVCRKCPLFYRPLSTCGSPLTNDLRDQGCWCHMPTKSKLVSAECWLDEMLGEDAPYGWRQYGI